MRRCAIACGRPPRDARRHRSGIRGLRTGLMPRVMTSGMGPDSERCRAYRKRTAVGRRPDVGGRYSSFNGAVRVDAQRLHQARFSRRQQLREHHEVVAAGRCYPERWVHVDPDHRAARREPQRALAGEQHVPGLMLLRSDQGVLAVGAEPSVWLPGSPRGAGECVVAPGSLIFGASTRLEMPAAEGSEPFFAAFSNTWRTVNSWKNRSPIGYGFHRAWAARSAPHEPRRKTPVGEKMHAHRLVHGSAVVGGREPGGGAKALREQVRAARDSGFSSCSWASTC